MAKAEIHGKGDDVLIVIGNNVNYIIDDEGFLTVKSDIPAKLLCIAPGAWTYIILTNGETDGKDNTTGTSESWASGDYITEQAVTHPVESDSIETTDPRW